MNYIICKPGERIKKIRIRIKMKQSELSGSTITRNLVSMIENGKSSLTMKTAMILSANINTFCVNNNKSFKITPQELLYSEEAQAKDICKDFNKLLDNLGIDFLKYDSKTHLDRIKEIMNVYNLTYEKATIYERIGHLYLETRNYEKSTTYLFLAYEYMTKVDIEEKNERLADIILKLVHGKKIIQMYDEALSISFSFKNSAFFKNCTMDTQSRIIYNNAICLKKANSIEKCISEIQLLEDVYENEIQSIPMREIEVKILKANALSEMHYISEATKIHKEILRTSKISLEYRIVTLCNLIEIFIRIKDSKNIKKFIDDAEALMTEYTSAKDNKFDYEVFMILGYGYKFINNVSSAEEMYLKTYATSRLRKRKDTLAKSLEELIAIYSESDNINKMENIKNLVSECYSSKLIDPSSTVILSLIEFYNEKQSFEVIKNIIQFAKNTSLNS